jgi:hypothetical protein
MILEELDYCTNSSINRDKHLDEPTKIIMRKYCAAKNANNELKMREIEDELVDHVRRQYYLEIGVEYPEG